MTVVADELRARLEELRGGLAYRNYELVRERVLRMKAQASIDEGGVERPSEYWSEELLNIEYMLDASPLVIDKLRHHCFHVTGIRPYEYRTHKDRSRGQFEEKLDALIEVGSRDLVVPEPVDLGGFGFEIDGGLFNIDTLKFLEVLIALDKGAVLGAFREGRERMLAWEIGAGWGGFPYQFKTLCPNTTYVITDFPELYLFSATYLMTMFPDARFGFFANESDQELVERWADYDFIFLPHTRLDLVSFDRLDLAINMVSFQEMTTEQVNAYVRHAFEQGCSYLYSLNRERSQYNPELSGVTQIIDEFFWPHEIDVLPVSYNQMLPPRKGKIGRPRITAKELQAGKKPPPNPGYKHLIGWRRVET
jgi:hypothetical protein